MLTTLKGKTHLSFLPYDKALVSLSFILIILDAFWVNVTGSGSVISLPVYTFHFIDLATPLLILSLTTSRPMIRVSPGLVLVASLLLITAIDFLRGLILDPFQAAFALRERSAYLLFGLSLMTSRDLKGQLKSLLPFMFFYGAALLLIFGLRMAYGAGLFLSEGGLDVLESNDLRLLNADAAVFLGLFSAMLVVFALNQKTRGRIAFGFAAALFMALELITRQRTATVATVVGLAVLILSSPGLLARMSTGIKIFAGAALACALAAVIVVGPSGLYSALPSNFQRAAEKRSTLTFRQAMWASATKSIEEREPLDLLMGPPSGQRPEIFFLNQRWVETLHSVYVETAFDFGVVGLAALVLTLLWGFTNIVSSILSGVSDTSAGLNPSLYLCWLVELAVFGYSYDLRSSLAVFLFTSLAPISMAYRDRPSQVQGRPVRRMIGSRPILDERLRPQTQWRRPTR